MDRIFYREKGTKPWREGWIVDRYCRKVKIGAYNNAPRRVWGDKGDLDMEKRP